MKTIEGERMRTLLEQDFFKPAYEKYIKFVMVISIITLFFGISYFMGWVLGNVLFFLSLSLKNNYFDFILTMKSFNKGLFILYFLASMCVILVTVGIGFIVPSLISPYACCLGFVGFKFFLVIMNIFGGEIF